MICKNCPNETRYSRNFCSLDCQIDKYGEKAIFGKKLSLVDKESLWWRDQWNMYHQGWIELESILSLMKDDILVNNKVYDTYNLFIPNNIKL